MLSKRLFSEAVIIAAGIEKKEKIPDFDFELKQEDFL